jgi:hypothetical protein
MSREKRELNSLPARWTAFLKELDGALDAPTQVHCIGGFVLVAHYGLPRATKDIDYLCQIGSGKVELMSIAGEGTPLATKHGVYVQRVPVACFPEDYETRLKEMFPGDFRHLRLMALDPYDLILTKLDRNGDVDRSDARYLIETLKLRAEILRERYLKEFKPYYVGDERRLDLTFQLWMEAYFGEHA